MEKIKLRMPAMIALSLFLSAPSLSAGQVGGELSEKEKRYEAQHAVCVEAMLELLGNSENAEKACTCRNSARADDTGRRSEAAKQ